MVKYFAREDDRNDLIFALSKMPNRGVGLSVSALADKIGSFVFNDWAKNKQEWIDGENPRNYNGGAMSKFIDDEIQHYINHTYESGKCNNHDEYLFIRSVIINNLARYGLDYLKKNRKNKSNFPSFRTKIWVMDFRQFGL